MLAGVVLATSRLRSAPARAIAGSRGLYIYARTSNKWGRHCCWCEGPPLRAAYYLRFARSQGQTTLLTRLGARTCLLPRVWVDVADLVGVALCWWMFSSGDVAAGRAVTPDMSPAVLAFCHLRYCVWAGPNRATSFGPWYDK